MMIALALPCFASYIANIETPHESHRETLGAPLNAATQNPLQSISKSNYSANYSLSLEYVSI